MKALRLTLVFGAVLVSASPGVSQFVKAALGFRLGYSPTERGYGQKPLILADNKKAVGVQLLSGVNGHTGWGNVGTARLATAGSAYGVGLQGGKQEGPLQAHVGNGAVRHLKILGLNLYLGGRAAPLAQGLGWKQPVAAASSAYGAASSAYGAPSSAYAAPSSVYAAPSSAYASPYSAPPKKPFSLLPLTLAHKPFFALPSFGYKARPSHHGNLIGGAGGIRASVGTPGYGVGFNLGYKQGINTKSPLGYALGLGGPRGPGPRGGWSSPIYKGADQVYIQGAPTLKTENTIILDTPIVTGLESQQQMTIQAMPTTQQQVDRQHEQQAQASQIQAVQVQPAQKPAGQQHQGLQGPFRQSARPSIFNLFGLASHSRPSILRPSPLHYSFNNAQSPAQSQSHMRVVPNHHPPTPAPQFSRANIPNEVAPQAAGWSTLFPVASQQQQTPSSSILQNFINPVPMNGQSLAKLQASLNGPVTSAQNQVPYYQPQYSGFGFPPRGLFARSFRPPRAPVQQSSPQQQQYSSAGFPGFANMFRGLYNAPFRPSQQSYVQPNLVQQQQQQQSPFATQQSPSYNLGLGQSAPLQLAQSTQPQQQQQVQNPDHYPRLPQIPFTADSMQFSPDPNFQYSHTISSSPVNMGTYTMNMNLGGNSGEQAGAPSTPVFGPNGRRIKKLKRARQDIIIKKQDTPSTTKDMMEASSSNSITMASSMGATQWTPLVYIDIPKLTRKSLDTPVQLVRQQVRLQQQPQIVAAPEEQSLDRSKILKRRRLASEEATTTQTVIPSSAAPTRSTTTTTTTTSTTTTTTPPPPPQSSSASPPAESVTTVSA